MPDSSEQGRRWTLTGIAFHGTGADRFATLPGIEPDLQRGEVVEVLPLSEHELVVQERDRLRAEVAASDLLAESAEARLSELTEAANDLLGSGWPDTARLRSVLAREQEGES